MVAEIRYLTLDEKMNGILEERIFKYEDRYEMSSCEMAKALSDGTERETAEKLRWMFDYHALEYIRKQTHTNGITGTTTSSSMRNGLPNTHL